MTDGQNKPVKYRPLTFDDSFKTEKAAEGRVAKRHLISRIVSCRLIRLPEPLAMEAKLHDISTSGIGVYSPSWLDPGTFLAITIEGWLGTQRTLRAKVVHATRVTKRCWLLGCSLDPPLSWQDVEELL
jgi:hypothetical protein